MTTRYICEQSGKVCYSQKDAGDLIRHFKNTRRRKRSDTGKHIPQRSYKCEFCGAYHLTHYKQYTSKNKHK